MADCALVVSAYTSLRDALTDLAVRTTLIDDRIKLLHRATVSGSLAERCEARFSGTDIAGGGRAIDAADAAGASARAAMGQDGSENAQVVAAANKANMALQAIVDRPSSGTKAALGVFATMSVALAAYLVTDKVRRNAAASSSAEP